MDEDVKSDTSYDTQVLPWPVKLFYNLCYEQMMCDKSMTELIDSSRKLLWQNAESDVSQEETIFHLLIYM